jgi:hypothetical protein
VGDEATRCEIAVHDGLDRFTMDACRSWIFDAG